jgi:hypothetical protein
MKQKEVMIQTLEQQLERERLRREEMTNKFRDQVNEFEYERDAIEKLRKASSEMQKQK